MAIRNPRLPLLPGYSPNTMIGKTQFGVRPIFTTIAGTNMLVDKATDIVKIPSLYARKSAPDLPAWILYDKQILRFQAYFQQTLQEMRDPAIIRQVDIFYYLEDGTIKVMEPKTENSGLLQGVLISRQRIRLPFSSDVYHDVLDLNVGRHVELYGKVFKIVDCDNFTRVYLNRLGIHVPDRIVMPSYGPPKYQFQPPKGPEKHFGLKQFLEFDRQVLKFHGFWDDRESESGIIHHMEIHYFLADDKMDIKELMPSNSGNDSGPVFLKKAKLPKRPPELIEMSDGCLGPFYTPADLTIGAVLNVYGRKVMLTDCDPFTREYYRIKYGLDNFTPMKVPEDTSRECVGTAPDERELPPWNGYGSYEDSAENCRTCEPKAPHRDFIKFLHKDRVGFDSHVLRFAARIISDVPDSAMRYFIVSYYLCDDTIGVFELTLRNSGFQGGRFLKRDIIYLPGHSMLVPLPPPTYTARDMAIGNDLIVHKHCFRLFAADEYALRYMELHPDEFPQSNVALVLDKIRRTLSSQENGYKNFVSKHMNAVLPNKTELMSAHCFKQALVEVLGENITDHEFVTLVRHFRGDVGREHRPHREMIRSLVFSAVTRELWDDRERLWEALHHADDTERGTLTRHRLRQLLRACRLPLPDQLMGCLLDVLEKDEECNIRYADLLELLDFKTRPVASVAEEELRKLARHAPPVKDTECQEWETADRLVAEGFVNWSAFLCLLNLEHTVKQ